MGVRGLLAVDESATVSLTTTLSKIYTSCFRIPPWAWESYLIKSHERCAKQRQSVRELEPLMAETETLPGHILRVRMAVCEDYVKKFQKYNGRICRLKAHSNYYHL
ncbi:hypothetical protein Nepgr_008151 [Nepenthes gracilis]|nr:hypothetical protein Nepgr_008151 [Nepenthes gracilis]